MNTQDSIRRIRADFQEPQNVHSGGRSLNVSLVPDLPRVGRTADGFDVFDSPKSFNCLAPGLLEQAISRVALGGSCFVEQKINFEEMLCLSHCVETTPGAEVFFARRVGRQGHSRFVRNRWPDPVYKATAVFRRLRDYANAYLLIATHIGERPPREPWDPRAGCFSRTYWANHAIVWGRFDTLPGSISARCLWPLAAQSASSLRYTP